MPLKKEPIIVDEPTYAERGIEAAHKSAQNTAFGIGDLVGFTDDPLGAAWKIKAFRENDLVLLHLPDWHRTRSS